MTLSERDGNLITGPPGTAGHFMQPLKSSQYYVLLLYSAVREAGLPHRRSVAMVKTHIVFSVLFVCSHTYCNTFSPNHCAEHNTNLAKILCHKNDCKNNPVGTFTKRRMKHKGLEFNGKVKKDLHVNGSEYFMQNSVCFSLLSKRNMYLAKAHALNWVLFTWAKKQNHCFSKLQQFQRLFHFRAHLYKIFNYQHIEKKETRHCVVLPNGSTAAHQKLLFNCCLLVQLNIQEWD